MKTHNQPNIQDIKPSFLSIALSTQVVLNALRVALVVGTILAFINHGDKLLTFSISIQDTIKILLTYCVPYSVSTWSAVKAINTKCHSHTSN